MMRDQLLWLHNHLLETEDAFDALLFEYGNVDADGAEQLLTDLDVRYTTIRSKR